MVTVQDAYSDTSSLLTGDIPLLPRHGDGTLAIKAAAEDIDAQIGHVYVTPIEIDDDPEYRPTRLLLKKINNLIASGRLLMDMAAAGEDDNNHAYGLFLLREGMDLLAQVTSGRIVLVGAEKIDGTEAGGNAAGPTIVNEDEESLVERFYRSGRYEESLSRRRIVPYEVN